MYLKLGKQASCFLDQATGLYLRNKEAVEFKGPKTKRIALALKNGAIEEIKEEEYLELKEAFDKANAPAGKAVVAAAPKEEEPADTSVKAQLSKMNEEQLLTYYKENFEVGEEEEAAFLKLKSKKAKVAFLTEDEE